MDSHANEALYLTTRSLPTSMSHAAGPAIVPIHRRGCWRRHVGRENGGSREMELRRDEGTLAGTLLQAQACPHDEVPARRRQANATDEFLWRPQRRLHTRECTKAAGA